MRICSRKMNIVPVTTSNGSLICLFHYHHDHAPDNQQHVLTTQLFRYTHTTWLDFVPREDITIWLISLKLSTSIFDLVLIYVCHFHHHHLQLSNFVEIHIFYNILSPITRMNVKGDSSLVLFVQGRILTSLSQFKFLHAQNGLFN